MTETRSAQAIQDYRVTHRLSLQPDFPYALPTVRLSLLDQRLRGDCWMVPRSAGLYGLCFDNRPLVYVSASSVDASSLNMLVDRLRHRLPVRRRRRIARRA
jgi:hypothetical protein